MVSVNFISQKSLIMDYANSENFYMYPATQDLSVIRHFIVPEIVQKFKDLCAPELGYGENNNNNNETNTDTNAGAHSDQGYLLGKQKVCTPKCPVSYVKKTFKKTNKKNNNKKKCK